MYIGIYRFVYNCRDTSPRCEARLLHQLEWGFLQHRRTIHIYSDSSGLVKKFTEIPSSRDR